MFSLNWITYPVDAANCMTLGSGTEWFQTDAHVVTDKFGIEREVTLATLDLTEICTWIVVMLGFELQTQMLERKIDKPDLMKFAGGAVIVCYLYLIFVISGYWVYVGEYYWVLDEMLWIVGFLFIDLNLGEWDEEQHPHEQGGWVGPPNLI